jgi:hypothetical protein
VFLSTLTPNYKSVAQKRYTDKNMSIHKRCSDFWKRFSKVAFFMDAGMVLGDLNLIGELRASEVAFRCPLG